MTEIVRPDPSLSPARPAPGIAARTWRRIDWKRIERRYDTRQESEGAVRVRRGMAILFVTLAAVMATVSGIHGDINAGPLVLVMGGVALYIGRGGRFIYYFVPAILGFASYGLASQLASHLKLGVHYLPQMRADEWLTPGSMPTIWLQQHLYHGSTGPLEVFSVAMYLSHFWIPLVLGFALAMGHRTRAFASLMFGLITVSVLGEITFVLLPTAPPWLAAEHHLLPNVHHILKHTLYDLHLGKVASLDGDPAAYDVTAAWPSLHVAFPVICILTAVTYRLPKWVSIALIANTLGVIFAIVYTGEHYLSDALAGIAYACAAWWITQRLLGPEPQPSESV
jgi:PAP2 superfamily